MADGVGNIKPNLSNPKRQNGGNTKRQRDIIYCQSSNAITKGLEASCKDARTLHLLLLAIKCWSVDFFQGVVDDGFGQQDLDDDDDKDGFDVLVLKG